MPEQGFDQQVHLPGRLPDNLQRSMKFLTQLVIRQPKMEGLDKLKEIDPEKPVIFAISHLSDIDLPAAASELLPFRAMDIAGLSTARTDFIQGNLMRLTGTLDRFLDITNTFDHAKRKPVMSFSPQDFSKMVESLKSKKGIIISAHNSGNWHLPNKPGIGAVYLSHLSGAPIVPVAVDIHSRQPVGMTIDVHTKNKAGLIKDIVRPFGKLISGNKPEVTIRIGTPIFLPLVSKEKLNRVLTSKETLGLLRQQGGLVMTALAGLLPAEKRGSWG